MKSLKFQLQTFCCKDPYDTRSIFDRICHRCEFAEASHLKNNNLNITICLIIKHTLKIFPQLNSLSFNRDRRKRPKVDAGIFDSALSHTRRSDASEKKKRK